LDFPALFPIFVHTNGVYLDLKGTKDGFCCDVFYFSSLSLHCFFLAKRN
jgi:hypothetical protein